MSLLDTLMKRADLGSVAGMMAKNPQLLGAAAALLSPSDSSVGGSGGLTAIMGSLRGNGLGDQVSSWIGSGANKAIDANQLTSALGSDTMSQFANKAGIDVAEAGSALSSLLPALIDQLTPDGNEPQGSAVEGLLAKLF